MRTVIIICCLIVTISVLQGCETMKGVKQDANEWTTAYKAKKGLLFELDEWMQEHMW